MKKKTKQRDYNALNAKMRKAAGPIKSKKARKEKEAVEKDIYKAMAEVCEEPNGCGEWWNCESCQEVMDSFEGHPTQCSKTCPDCKFEKERKEAIQEIRRWMHSYPPSDHIRDEICKLSRKYVVSVFEILEKE